MNAEKLTALMDKAAGLLRKSGHGDIADELQKLEVRDQGMRDMYLIFPRTRKVDMGENEMRRG